MSAHHRGGLQLEISKICFVSDKYVGSLLLSANSLCSKIKAGIAAGNTQLPSYQIAQAVLAGVRLRNEARALALLSRVATSTPTSMPEQRRVTFKRAARGIRRNLAAKAAAGR